MYPVKPSMQNIPNGTVETVYTSKDPEVGDLPSLKTPGGIVISRWTLTEEERQMLLNGVDIYLAVATYNDPLQPVILTVGPTPSSLLS